MGERDNYAPDILMLRQEDGLFRATIFHGPAFTGVGKTKAEALKYAAEAWYWHEAKEAEASRLSAGNEEKQMKQTFDLEDDEAVIVFAADGFCELLAPILEEEDAPIPDNVLFAIALATKISDDDAFRNEMLDWFRRDGMERKN